MSMGCPVAFRLILRPTLKICSIRRNSFWRLLRSKGISFWFKRNPLTGSKKIYSDTKAKLNVKVNAPRNKIIIRLLILDSWRILKPKAVKFRNHKVLPSSIQISL